MVQLFEMAHILSRFAVALGGYGAGVDYVDIRLFARPDTFEAALFQRLLHRRLVTDVCQHDLIVEIQVSLQEHRLNFFLQLINSLLFLRRYRDHFLPARFAKRFFCENRFQICLI